ncbi:MAG: glycoside hydrolase family 9 protein [Bacillota bacterium]|nr:glycoside hydrolase family 9 protein [Bacillota bacterium]
MKSKRLLVLWVLIAVVCTTAIVPMMVVNASAPAGWRNLPDFYVFKDKISGWSGCGAGELETINSNLPVDTQVTYQNLPSLRFNLQTKLTGGWMSVVVCMADWNCHDVTQYVPNGYLEFNVKGKNGGENFKIGAVDHVCERPSGVEKTITKSVSSYSTVTTSWQHVKIPLKDILDPSLGMDPYNAKAIVLDRVTDDPFCVWINQLKITSPDKEKGFPAIKVNQVGFTETSEKYALVSGFEDELKAVAGTQFQVKKVSDNSVAYTGQLVLVADYDANDSGERVLKAVFTDLKQTGDYYITVSADGIDKSPKFKIGNDSFKSLLVDASKYYYYQRANIDLASPYCADYPRKDKSPQDFNCALASNSSITKDVSKGWYDAGDPNKYVITGAQSASNLLSAYEMYPEVFYDKQNNIPESGNGVPDILDEVRWELEWMLKMQEAASGGFYCCVAFTDNFSSGQRVIMDKKDSTGNIKSTNDTAAAVGVLAQASMIYSKYDSAFAKKCLDAAKSGWAFLLQNPNNIKAPGGAYPADNDECSRFFAAASLYRATGDSSCNDYVKANYNKVYASESGDGSFGWENGFYSYMKAKNRDSNVESWFKDSFTKWANNKLNRSKNNPWGNVIENGNYYWGSNSVILGCPREVLLGSAIFGTNSDDINKMARSSLNWILGANPMRKSLVSGYGDYCIKEIFTTWSEDGLAGIPKGIMPGGPNKYNGANISIFPAKCYMESAAEFTTNEHTLGWNSLLVFMAAFANSTSTSTPQNSADLDNDGVVNMKDVILLAKVFNSVRGDNQYIASYDLNSDDSINMLDVIIIAKAFNTVIT